VALRKPPVLAGIARLESSKGDQVIATNQEKAQAQKPRTNIDLALAKAIRLCALAGYRLSIEPLPKIQQPQDEARETKDIIL
jgi:hypothetical protein